MEEEVYLGFGDYLTILQRRKKQFMIPAVVVLFIGAALAIGLPSVYKSQATILIEQQEIPTDLVRSTVTSYAGERIQVISQRIMTTENLSKIIDDYGLYKNERDDASTTFLAKKLHDEIQLEMVSADVVDPRSGRPTTATIAFKLSFSDRNPRVAQKVTNQLVSLYLDENLKQRAQSALETSSFLNAESEKYKHQISDLEAKLAVFKEANFSSLPELQQLNIQLMERNDRDLADVDKQIRNLEEKKIYMQSELAQLSPTNDLYNSRGNRVLGTEDRLRELRTQYVSLSARYTDNHPTLVKLLEEMEALKEELNSNDYESGSFDLKSENPAYVQLKTQLQAVDTELATLKDMRITTKKKQSELESRLIQSPQVEREYLNLTRDYENAVAKYQEVKSKQLEAELAESLERESKGERFSLVEPPQLPEQPDKPNRILIFMLGIAASIGSGLGSVILKEGLDQTVYGSNAIRSIIKEPPLAIIPYIDRNDIKRMNITRVQITVVLISAIMLALVLVNSFMVPLDVVWYVVLRKFGLNVGEG